MKSMYSEFKSGLIRLEEIQLRKYYGMTSSKSSSRQLSIGKGRF